MPKPSAAAEALLAWYDRHARRLPWRVGPKERAAGVHPDPYRVWLSEVMLQQTTVAAVKPYFDAFLARWPTVADLAAAPEAEVMKAWAGLGYYARARNLKAAAEEVARLGGRFPESSAGLRALPGIGDYTAAAVAAIAFDEPAPAVDANIERVIARLIALAEPLPGAKPAIRAHMATLMPATRAGDFVQAMMDLGAAICSPKRPACALCPLAEGCSARRLGDPEGYPRKAEKPDRPTRAGAAFVAVRADGAILLRRRAPKGLLGGMTEVPGSDWATPRQATRDPTRAGAKSVDGPDAGAPFTAGWSAAPGTVVQVFTHFRLELRVFRAEIEGGRQAPPNHWWSLPAALPGEALPSVMKKAIEAAVPGATKRRQ